MSRGFRGDVQGLRAIAVLLVALDHAVIGPFSGGFVGVDVFFVISGFLITSLLMAEATRDGHVSLMGFYSRRARRILPAATFVLLVTVAASVIFLSGVEALSAIEDAIWATFFAANFKFASDGTDYFNAEAAPSPLQHFWSLAVEEQFYLVWPLVILLICLVAHRLGKRSSINSSAVGVLSVIVAASFVWSVVHTQNDAVTAYFSPLTRAWELGVGALAACLTAYFARANRHALAVFSWLGLAAILWSAVAYDEHTLFPGYAAAVPVLGTALLLVCGLASASWGPQRLISVPPMRVVGDWSYSFYLWHWPALVIAAAIWGPIAGWSGALVLAFALGLSGLTYVLIENPFRRSPAISRPPRRGLLLYPAAVVLVLPLMVTANNVVEAMSDGGGRWISTEHYGQDSGDPDPQFSEADDIALVEASVLAAHNGMRVPHGLSPSPLLIDDNKPDVGECEYSYPANAGKLCPRGETSADRTLVVVGDSHARQWVPAIEPLAKKYGYQAYFLVRVGCPGADITPWLSDGSGPSLKCQEFQDWAAREIEQLQPDVTIIGSAVNPEGWSDEDGNHITDPDQVTAMFRDGIRRQVDRVEPSSGRVIVIGDPPSTLFQGGVCLSKRSATLESCMSEPDPTSKQHISAARQGARAAGAEYVDTTAWFCRDGGCPAVVGHYVTRRDLQHVTVEYAAHLTDALGRKLDLGGPTAALRAAS